MISKRRQHVLPYQRRSDAARRRGTVIAAALVEFLVAAAILFAVLQSVVGHHRQLLKARHEVQAQWLAQAGIDRAVAQLGKSASYQGETWHVPAEELDGMDAAEVQIRVERVAENSDELHLTVEARDPSDPIHCVKQTREVTIHLQ
jgi:type II secretory pathway component PulK